MPKVSDFGDDFSIERIEGAIWKPWAIVVFHNDTFCTLPVERFWTKVAAMRSLHKARQSA